MEYFAKKTELTFEICVACFLHWKKKCVDEGEAIPEKLLSNFGWAQIRGPCVLIRNHKNLCYKPHESAKKCCDPEDDRVVVLSIPFIRQFATDEDAAKEDHPGKNV